MTPSKVAHTLIRFATTREKALRHGNALSGDKLDAITVIKRKAEYFKSVPESKQIAVVRQVETELRLILPHEKSRFQKQRKTILDLIELSHD